MNRPNARNLRDGRILSAALKAIRKHRAMTASEVARAMNMPIRTYERFEAGEARLNLDYIHRFAKATDSDPYAILLAVVTGSPEVARRCADNKLATILTIAFGQFDATAGDRLQDLDPRTLVTATTEMFDSLLERIDKLEDSRSWLNDGERALSARRPRPGR